MTKLMTLLVVFEEMRSKALGPDTTFAVSEHAWRDGNGTMSPTPSIFLDLYAKVPLSDLVDGMAIASANDAAITAAEGLAGSESAFVTRMNDEAQKLGLQHTTFANVTGITDPGQRASARDLAVLARHLLRKFPASTPPSDAPTWCIAACAFAIEIHSSRLATPTV